LVDEEGDEAGAVVDVNAGMGVKSLVAGEGVTNAVVLSVEIVAVVEVTKINGVGVGRFGVEAAQAVTRIVVAINPIKRIERFFVFICLSSSVIIYLASL
jgi:hypothetical protein